MGGSTQARGATDCGPIALRRTASVGPVVRPTSQATENASSRKPTGWTPKEGRNLGVAARPRIARVLSPLSLGRVAGPLVASGSKCFMKIEQVTLMGRSLKLARAGPSRK